MNQRKKEYRAWPRFLALDILSSWQRLNPPGGAGGPFLDELLAESLARHADLTRPDQALLRELATGVLRWRRRLDYVIAQVATTPIQRLHPVVLDILRLTAYQLLFLDRIPAPAAVSEAVKLAKARRLPPTLAAFINAVGRKLAAPGAAISFPDPVVEPVAALAVGTSLPEWLAERWLRDLGPKQAWHRGQASNERPPLTIRTNTALVSRETLGSILAEEGIATSPCRLAPLGLNILSVSQAPFSLPSWQRGLWLFQDEAAQLVTLLLQARPGQRILEIGAGRGGKTTHLAQILGGRGLILALDNNQRRLTGLQQQLRRLQLTGVEVLLADATRPLPLAAENRFDRVLIDAPCSGLGVLRRHPELKWRRQPEDITRFAARQRALLAQASPYVRLGGLLLYITCTTTPEENEKVVQDFLADQPDFALLPGANQPPSPAREFFDAQGFFRTSPEEHNIDGFFAAILRRNF